MPDDVPKPGTTRDRILGAAIAAFARGPYDAVSLRDIAAASGVDVAHVHRSFGSKEKLFALCLEATLRSGEVLAEPRDVLPQALARQVMTKEAAIGPLDVAIHSLASPAARPVLRDVLVRDFLHPLAHRMGRPADARVALAAALLAGTDLLREVLGLEMLRQDPAGEVEALLAGLLTALLVPSPAEG